MVYIEHQIVNGIDMVNEIVPARYVKMHSHHKRRDRLAGKLLRPQVKLLKMKGDGLLSSILNNRALEWKHVPIFIFFIDHKIYKSNVYT